jgi:hypothetical protein
LLHGAWEVVSNVLKNKRLKMFLFFFSDSTPTRRDSQFQGLGSAKQNIIEIVKWNLRFQPSDQLFKPRVVATSPNCGWKEKLNQQTVNFDQVNLGIGVRRRVSKWVKNGRRPPTLWMGYPCPKAVSGVARLQGVEG